MAMTICRSNKPLLIVNSVYSEYSSWEDVYVINEDKLERFNHASDTQSPDYKNIHVVIKYNDETKVLVKKYLPLLKKYIANKNNQIDIRLLAVSSEYFFNALALEQDIDSIKAARDLSKDSKAYDSEVFELFLRIITPNDYLPKHLVEISIVEALNRLDKLLEVGLKLEFEPVKEMPLGKYPQKLVKDQVIIDKLNKQHLDPNQNRKWIPFEYRANDYDGPYMFYIDVELDGKEYRGVYLKEYRPPVYGDNIARSFESGQKANGFALNTNYWFEYSSIEWLIINQEKGLSLSKYVLDAEAAAKDRNARTIDDLKTWISKAFDENKKIGLLTIEECKEIIDRNIRKPKWTDYALIKGFVTKTVAWYDPFVWLEGPIKYGRVTCVAMDGTIINDHIENYGYCTLTIGGVRPALKK